MRTSSVSDENSGLDSYVSIDSKCQSLLQYLQWPLKNFTACIEGNKTTNLFKNYLKIMSE